MICYSSGSIRTHFTEYGVSVEIPASIECDLLEATKECKTVIELLRAERLDESVWDELYQSALDLSESFDIVENMPRRHSQKW